MKRLFLTVTGLGALLAAGVYVHRLKIPADSPAASVPESTPASGQLAASAPPAEEEVGRPRESLRQDTHDVRPLKPGQPAPADTTATDLVFHQAIETLLSGQAGFEEKQAAWRQLKNPDKLEQTIRELEQRTTAEPQNPECSAALGQAYLKKCALIDDIREKAILAMKADQFLDAALSLDPLHWEARFTKAVAMSYWPAQLNKGREVVEQFETLIMQQEAQPPQPHFARSYVRLGDQYQKAGYPESAAQIWTRGVAWFPRDKELVARLASAPDSH